MPKIYGRDYTPTELRALTATVDQLAGIRLIEYCEGNARGMRAAEVWTGSGFNFTVWIDRGLDIGPADYKGSPLAWLHPALGAPAFHEPEGRGWLHTFGGGLVTTCGLSHIGQPEESEGQKWGLHGRISHITPTHVSTFAGWIGDDYILKIEGEVRESQMPVPNLLLRRCITTRLGSNSLTIKDTITNQSFVPVPHMLLYHINFGFPVIAPGTRFEVDTEDTQPRDSTAASGLADYAVYHDPDPDFKAQVFFHTPRPAPDGYVTVRLNSPLGCNAYVRYHAAELPSLTQWKMTQAGVYVSAVEPCTAHEGSRALRRSQNRLHDLAPGESIDYEIEIGVE